VCYDLVRVWHGIEFGGDNKKNERVGIAHDAQGALGEHERALEEMGAKTCGCTLEYQRQKAR